MLAKRIIPCLDVSAGRVVKGVNFVDLRDAGEPVEQAAVYDKAGADELCFLDLGGGVRNLGDIRRLLLAGADKVSINSAAIADPDLVRRSAEKFGSQCVTVAMDAKATSPGKWAIFSHGGRTATGLDALAWAMRGTEWGAGEILLTSMDRDGTKLGYDLELPRAIADAVGVPVIASGGVGELAHLVAGVREGHADALLAASIFHFGQFSIAQAKAALAAAGVPVRPG